MENLFDIPSEYKDLRASVRALAEKEIAPFANNIESTLYLSISIAVCSDDIFNLLFNSFISEAALLLSVVYIPD